MLISDLWLRPSLEFTKSLNGDDLEAILASQPELVLGPQLEIGQIVLEFLDQLV